MKQGGIWIMALVLGFGMFVFADEPKDLNCDFENGMDRWRGDGRLREDEKGNRVCMLKKTGTRREEITHKIRLPGNLTFDIHYRVRAMPGGEKVRIRHAVKDLKGGAGFVTKDLVADGKWVEMKFGAKAAEGDRKSDRTVAIIFHEGKGVIEIDDIKVVNR